MNCNCPQCGSENTQAVQVLLDAGTQRGKSATSISGVGIGLGGGLGVGLGSATGSNVQQSDLARRFALPKYPRDLGPYLFLGIGFLILAAIIGKGAEGCGGLFVLVGLACVIGFFANRKSRKQAQLNWEARRHYLSQAWFCHRCGKEWVPSQGD